MEVADRVALEFPLRRPVALDIRQSADAVALQTAVQGRPRQVRDRWLQRVEAIVERQQRVAAEGHNNGLFLARQNRRSRLPGAGGQIGGRTPLLPLRDRLGLMP